MSGGHWDYMDQKLREQGTELKELFDFLAAVEHELDWGICCDTCPDCAERRVAKALILFFDGNTSAAIALARDQEQHRCGVCEAADKE